MDAFYVCFFNIVSSYYILQLICAPTTATVFSFRVAQMQLRVRGQARALDCVCSIISSRLHVRVKTHVYKVLRCKSCEAWHEFCHAVVSVIAVCANNKFQNCVFNPFQARCQFNWEWFKRMKLYISDVLYPLVRFPLVAWAHDINCDVPWCPSLRKILWPFYRSCSLFWLPDRSRILSSPSRHDYPRGKDYFVYSQAAAQLLLSRFLRGRWQGWKVATERSPLFRERLSDPRGCRRSCRRSQDAEDAKERSRTGRRGQWNWNGESGSQNRLA